jgi:hypothetical protein
MQISAEARRLGDPLLVALADSSACWLHLLGRYDAAETGFRSVLEIERALGYATWDADTLRGLGLARLGLGRRADARRALVSSLEPLATGSPTAGVELTASLQWLALAAVPGDARSAARLLGAVAAIRQNARLTGWPGEHELRRRFERPLIEALGDDDWARDQAAGATLSLQEAIALGRTLAATQPETTDSG